MGAYVALLASAQRAAMGVRKEAEWRSLFDAVEQRFKVERWVILAIWGMETSYGALKDKWDTVSVRWRRSAHAKYRDPYFRDELLVALKILQDERMPRDKFAQLLGRRDGPDPVHAEEFYPTTPSTFNGDGKRDIWGSVPDAIGSTGNYLSKQRLEAWAYPGSARKPSRRALTTAQEPRRVRCMDQAWRQTRRRQGLSPSGEGILFFPTGMPGPGFIITENYHVLPSTTIRTPTRFRSATSPTGCAAARR